MFRKTLVVLRVLFVAYFFILIIFGRDYPSVYFPFTHVLFPNGCGAWGCNLGLSGWAIALIISLAFTTWIDSIDARLNPKPPIPAKTRNIKAIVALLITIVAATIGYISTR
ncbi:MAG: hypothetical protein Q7S01_01785 [bacterium]|nr:hypothetical protein [bacterium]